MLIAMLFVLDVTSLASAAPASAPTSIELPSEVRAAADQLVDHMRQRWYMFSGVVDPAIGMRRVEEAGQQLDEGLQQLARRIPQDLASLAKENEAKDIRAKLITIAVDRAGRPEVYAEIDQKYIHFSEEREMRTPFVPFPDHVHVQEKYRLAWEYWLLWPGVDLRGRHVVEGVLYAIQRIGNSASLLSLEFSFRLTSRQVGSVRQVQSTQMYLLRSLAGFKTSEGLRTTLRCLAEFEKLPYKDDPEYKRMWWWDDRGPVEHVARLVSEPAVRAQWQKVLKGMDRSALPDSELRALDRLEHIAASRPAP